MGMTSQAEAKLDARIRPELTVLRSRTSYPQRHRHLSVATANSPGGSADDSVAAAASVRPASDRPRSGQRVPVRLTRRGRVVVGMLVTIGVVLLAGLLWLTIGGQAQASSHLPGAGRGERGMLKVVVRPGQTLWAIAVRADPAADPRVIIGEIVSDNELTGTGLQAGQVLWVPRS